MPSGLIINYYGEEAFTPPSNQPYDPAYPSVKKIEPRTAIVMWQKYRNLLHLLRR